MKTNMFILGCLLMIGAVVYASNPMPITQCTVTAGKGSPSDSIVINGSLQSEADYIAGAVKIDVKIECASMLNDFLISFPVNNDTFKKDKFKSVIKDGSSTYSFACDTKSSKFTFSAKNADLTGLRCPFTLRIEISPTAAEAILDEDIVNGTKTCPSTLMMGVFNALDVTKFSYKLGKNAGTDSFCAQGTFNMDGEFQLAEPFFLTLGSAGYYVPGSAFKSNKGVVSCSNAPAQKGGIVSAKFDTNTGAFTIAVKNTSIEDFGPVNFDLSLFGILLGVTETADLGPKQMLSLENDLRHFNDPGTWNFTPDGYRIVTGTSGPNYYSRFDSNTDDILYLFTDSNGTYLKGANLSGESYECSITSNVLTNPALMRCGQTFTSEANFTGSLNIWIPDEPDIDVTVSGFGGTVKVTTKLLKWENVSVPASVYNALKIEQTFALSGTMDVYLYDNSEGDGMDTTGTFTCTYKYTYWCEPSIGVIKMIDNSSERVTAKGAGSLSDSWSSTYSLTSHNP